MACLQLLQEQGADWQGFVSSFQQPMLCRSVLMAYLKGLQLPSRMGQRTLPLKTALASDTFLETMLIMLIIPDKRGRQLPKLISH